MSRNNLIIITVVAIVLIGGWLLLNSQKSTQPASPSPLLKPTKTASPSATTEENAVTITSRGFEPATITIKAGKTVTWVNNDSVTHQVNSAVHPTHQVYPPLNSVGLLKPRESKSLTFPQAGSFKYHDHLNPSLTGTVVVK